MAVIWPGLLRRWYRLLVDKEGLNWRLCVLLLEGSQRRQSWGLKELVKTQVVTWMWNVSTERVRGEWGNRNDTFLLVDSPARVQVQWGEERETLSVIWVSHHRQCSHICGAEGVGSKNQPWAGSAWPLLWLTWEWQDYAILQANPFSNQLSQHHIWWKMWFGLDFRWVSALAYSTDRAGCVSHPTPTRRCTHDGLELNWIYKFRNTIIHK